MFTLPMKVVFVVVVVAAGIDLWTFRIHNALTLPFVLCGLMYHALVGDDFGLTGSVAGLLVGVLPFVMLYAKGGMGAGDLKLMAGVGAWLGPWFALHVIIVSGLATGCLSAGLMLRNRALAATRPGDRLTHNSLLPEQVFPEKATNVTDLLNRPNYRSKAVPFGAMVALGVIVATLWIG